MFLGYASDCCTVAIIIHKMSHSLRILCRLCKRHALLTMLFQSNISSSSRPDPSVRSNSNRVESCEDHCSIEIFEFDSSKGFCSIEFRAGKPCSMLDSIAISELTSDCGRDLFKMHALAKLKSIQVIAMSDSECSCTSAFM